MVGGVGTELLRLADSCPSQFIPSSYGDIVSVVERFEGLSLGADWTDPIPASIADIWESLSLEAKLVAFIVGAHNAYWMNRD